MSKNYTQQLNRTRLINNLGTAKFNKLINFTIDAQALNLIKLIYKTARIYGTDISETSNLKSYMYREYIIEHCDGLFTIYKGYYKQIAQLSI